MMSHSNRPFGLIYKIVNNVNGKVYIGQTIQQLKNRAKQYRSEARRGRADMAVVKAIRKYGWDMFTMCEIDCADSREELDYMEKYWIKFYRSMERQFGYNLREGGNCSPVSDETRIKISKTLTGRRMSEERKRSQSFPIICVETQQVFGSAHEIADLVYPDGTERQKRYLRRCIGLAARTNRKSYGLHWSYDIEQSKAVPTLDMMVSPHILEQKHASQPRTIEQKQRIRYATKEAYRKQPKAPTYLKAVLCVETGQIHRSRLDAVRRLAQTPVLDLQYCRDKLSRAVKTGKPAFGFHWKDAVTNAA